jgi:Cyclin M transmembrane N-terminal domain
MRPRPCTAPSSIDPDQDTPCARVPLIVWYEESAITGILQRLVFFMLGGTSQVSLLTWLGIAACILQPAAFSGLNLGVFSVSKLRLELEAAGGNPHAVSALEFRKDSNLTLATILWAMSRPTCC